MFINHYFIAIFILVKLIFCICDDALPNIVIVLTDDLDLTLDGMIPMERMQRLIANRTASFPNAFTTSPICCPSRASILSGQYAHNHATVNNSQAGGCYSSVWRKMIEPRTFPVLLENNGYTTFYAGKYLNRYYSKDIPPGYSQWFGLHGNSKYYNYTLNENGELKQYGESENDYLTDVIRNHTLNFLSKQTNKKPFLTFIATPAPHEPFIAAKRHANAFENVKAPRTPNFNIPSGILSKHWIARMPESPLSQNIIDNIDSYYRKRWQTLLAVDELVEEIIEKLIEMDLFENTYFIFTSDNGYHLGQFSMPFDKRQPYETDIRVPLILSIPTYREKLRINRPVALIDLAPTILSWANITIPDWMDGGNFQEAIDFEDNSIDGGINNNENNGFVGNTSPERRLLIEYWGEGDDGTGNDECGYKRSDRLNHCTLAAGCHCEDSWNNTYGCVRHLGTDINKIYCEFIDRENFVEAYDMQTDLYQMMNLGYEMLPSERAQYSLQLEKLKQCSGKSCN